jgi:hypothetical protein
MEKFDILFDKSVFAITAIIIIILVMTMLFTFFLFRKQNNKTILIITSIFVFAPLFVTSFFIPISYSISEKEIIIHKIIGKTFIHKNDIDDIFVIHSHDLQGMSRTFASGGFGGYFGKYSSPKYGIIHVYAGTLSKNLIMIQLKDNTLYLITPKEMDKILITN